MRWTQAVPDEGMRVRTAKACGPVPPTLGSTPGQKPGGRRLKSPVLRGERAISRKPLRREGRIASALPDDLVGTFPFQPTSLSGAASIRLSLRPPAFSEGQRFRITRAIRAAGLRRRVSQLSFPAHAGNPVFQRPLG
jgi:hypothetical protein